MMRTAMGPLDVLTCSALNREWRRAANDQYIWIAFIRYKVLGIRYFYGVLVGFSLASWFGAHNRTLQPKTHLSESCAPADL